jgi:tRNA (cmo5U34)-methyltransferase
MPIDEAFNASIAYYDDWMRKALPDYDALFGTACELAPFESEAPLDVLDLGAGTGLFSWHILERFPNARFVLYDLADRMLSVARDRFRGREDRCEFAIGDYRTLDLPRTFDLVISSLSIHHLEDGEKRDLFRSIHRVLKTPGAFLNVDQVRGETPYLRDLYWNHWLAQVRSREPDETRIRESIDRRIGYDRDSLLGDQLRWLSEAGFLDVDCVYKNYFVGVFLARKG